MNRLLSILSGFLCILIFVHAQEGYAQAIDPLIDSPGNTIGSDFNGDGIHDIIVGAYLNDDGVGGDGNGAAYVFFGASNFSGTKDLSGTDADATFLGKASGDNFGQSVASAGDVNGDGYDDIIVQAKRNDDGAVDAGAAYIFFGASGLSGTKSLGAAQSADFTILGKAVTDELRIVAGAGDVNGDGFDDIVVSTTKNDDGPGTVAGVGYLFFGSGSLSGTKSLGAAQSADFTVLGKADGDRLGVTISGAGDVNGDGFDDIIVGADRNDDGPGNDAGAAYIFFGASSLSGTKSLGEGQSADFTILGKAASDNLGVVGGAGDVNGDGFDDFIACATQNDDGVGNNGGAAYIIFGASGLSGTKSLGGGDFADITILAKAASDRFGFANSGIGDVNGDGIDDFMVAADLNNDGGTDDEGAVYIFFGASDLSGTKDLGRGQSADFTVLGKAANDYLGSDISGVGDVNQDGFSDVIIGARGNDEGTGGNNNGAAYIFFGASNLSGTKDLGGVQSADVTVLGKAALDRLGRAVGGGRSNPGP